MNKPKIAIVRGKFLNRYEMQFFEPLIREFDITAFGSSHPYHDRFRFPVIKLPSPMDLPDFSRRAGFRFAQPILLPILNRLFVDAHYLWGVEEKLKSFDLVHTAETYFHYTQQCLNAKRKGYVKKVIATVLENIPHNNEGIWGRKAFKARARKELDHIIALTQKTKEALLLEGTDEKKITVISHFVDTKRFRPSRKPASTHLTILFVGRLETYKGVFDILEAARLLSGDPDVRKYKLIWRFVGDGSQKGEMERLEKAYGLHAVHTTASYDTMPKQYDTADIFIAPSKPMSTWQEQYCTALLEAQAAGLPIVTTRTGGIPENIGGAGVVVEPGNVSDLAQVIKSFIVDPAKRKEFAQIARKRAETVHDIRIGARKLADLYRSLLRDDKN